MKKFAQLIFVIDPDLYEDYVEFPDGCKDCPYFK